MEERLWAETEKEKKEWEGRKWEKEREWEKWQELNFRRPHFKSR